MNLSQFCNQSIFGNNGTYIYCVLEWNWNLRLTMVGACVNDFSRVQSNYIIWKMNLSAGLSLFINLVIKNLGSVFGCHTDSSIWIYNTCCICSFFTSFSKPAPMTLVGISPIGMELMFSEFILGQYLTNIWCD